MFLTINDFDGFNRIEFKQNEVMSYEDLLKSFTDLIKVGNSLYFYVPGYRKVVEDQYFWKALGNLIGESKTLENLK